MSEQQQVEVSSSAKPNKLPNEAQTLVVKSLQPKTWKLPGMFLDVGFFISCDQHAIVFATAYFV